MMAMQSRGLEFKELWDTVTERFRAWWERELKNPLIQLFVPRKGLEKEAILLYNRWQWGFPRNPENPSETIKAFIEWCKSMAFLVDAYPNLWINLGPGIIAGYFGAKVVFKEYTVWFGASADLREAKNWDEIEDIVKFDEGNYWWRKTIELTLAALEHGKNRYIVGITDLGGVHDILASLRGTGNIIKDMYFNPRKVEDISWRILDLWHTYYDKLYEIIKQYQYGTSAWMGLWSPRRWYPIQCDLSALLSPKLFQRFVLPILEEQCKRLDHIIYHLDGPGELPHVDYILRIEKLNGIQWVPGAKMDAEGRDCGSDYWLQFYKKVLDYEKNLVISVPCDKVMNLLEKLLKVKGVAIQVECPNIEKAKILLGKLMEKTFIPQELYKEIQYYIT